MAHMIQTNVQVLDNSREAQTPGPTTPSDARERLRQHFNVPYAEHNNKWENLWQTGGFLPWDKGAPNPALVDLLTDRQDLIGRPVHAGEERRKRALVPGCGKGYDVLLLASFGYDAYGLEISASAVKACEEFAKAEFASYTRTGSDYGCGTCKFVQGDFFADDWATKSGLGPDGFDLVYDYTFLSALPPETRPAWSQRMADLLTSSPDGRLICVEFPTYKEPHTGGPPYALPPTVYLAHLSDPGEHVAYDQDGYVQEDIGLQNGQPGSARRRSAKGLKRLAHWQPKRTHAIGQGTDWVSVWGHQ